MSARNDGSSQGITPLTMRLLHFVRNDRVAVGADIHVRPQRKRMHENVIGVFGRVRPIAGGFENPPLRQDGGIAALRSQ
jgi:hypothetical protein